ncbi:hypothetical protein ACLUWA_08505, partial [Bifidobacterium thermophilum]
MVYEFDGTKHGKLRDMRAARRAKHPDPVRGGTDFTRAAHAVGAPKRTVTAWRNGRTRSTGRNERPLSDRYRGGMDEHIAIADLHRAGNGDRAIARTPAGRPAPTRTPTARRASTPPREPTRPDTPRNTSAQPPRNPTVFCQVDLYGGDCGGNLGPNPSYA